MRLPGIKMPNTFGGVANAGTTIRNLKGQLESITGYRSDKLLLIGQREPAKSITDSKWLNYLGDPLKDSINNGVDVWNNYVKDEGRLTQQGVEVDAIMTYEGQTSVKFTENPLQDGVNINDHRIIQPDIVVLELGVSNDVKRSALNNFTDSFVGLYVSPFLDADGFVSEDRRLITYKGFRKLMEEGLPFDLQTPYYTYKNMLVKKINPRSDASTLGLFYGTITFRKAMIIEDATTDGEDKNPPKASVNQAIETIVNKVKGLF